MAILTEEMERYWKEVDKRRVAPRGRRSSTLISTSIDSDRTIDQEFIQCGHCGRHIVWQRDTYRVVGRCGRCKGDVCGPDCPMGLNCAPVEKTLEMMERGIGWNQIRHVIDREPVKALVPAGVPVSPGGVLLGS